MISKGTAEPFQLIPTAVWSLDKEAQEMADSWIQCLDPTAKQFVRHASSWQGIRDIVKEFTQESFRTQMQEAGIIPPSTSRVSVVLIAYGMGSVPSAGWKDSEKKLDKISKELDYLESHRILLARLDQHMTKDRDIRCSGVRDVTWLLTDKTHLGTTLGKSEFRSLVHSLLNALVLSERNSDQDQTYLRDFFDSGLSPSEVRRKVRLIASPGNDLAELFNTRAKQTVQAVISYFSSVHPVDTAEKKQSKSKILESLDSLLKGQIRTDQFVQYLSDELGKSYWSLPDLLSEAPGFLRHLARTVQNHQSPSPSAASPPSFMQRLLRCLAVRLGIRRYRATSIPRPLCEQLRSLANHLDSVACELDKICADNRASPCEGLTLKPQEKERWKVPLEDILKGFLTRSQPAFADLLMQDFVRQVMRDLQNSPELFPDLASLLGKSLRFSARLSAAKRPQARVVLSSIQLGSKFHFEAQQLPTAVVRLWPYVSGPLVLIASEPVPIRQIRT